MHIRGKKVLGFYNKGQAMKRRNINWDNQPLGEMFDPVIAKRLGVNTTTVRRARVRRGIGPYRGEYTGKSGAGVICPECGYKVDEATYRERFNKDKLCRDCWVGRYPPTPIPVRTSSPLAGCEKWADSSGK